MTTDSVRSTDGMIHEIKESRVVIKSMRGGEVKYLYVYKTPWGEYSSSEYLGNNIPATEEIRDKLKVDFIDAFRRGCKE